MKTVPCAIGYLAVLLTGVRCHAETPQLWYDKPAASWSEALPIGNGRLAALVYGGIGKEHLQLNEETIYAGKRMDRVNPEARTQVPAVRRLLLEGKVREAERVAAHSLLAKPTRQPPYEPLGDLEISFDGDAGGASSEYRRALDLFDGVASVQYRQSGVLYTREIFASYPDQAIVVHLKANGQRGLSFHLILSRAADASAAVEKNAGTPVLVLRGKAMPPMEQGKHGWAYANEPKTGTGFIAAVGIMQTGGKLSATGGQLTVSGAEEATVVLTASTDARVSDPDRECRQQLKRAMAHPAGELLRRSREDFRRIAARVRLNLGTATPELAALPTDGRLKRFQSGLDDPALIALYFQYGRYLLQSSSRENSLAANLQGKWNEDYSPAWGSKYTININTEMNYWPAETCNLPETVKGLQNLIANMSESGRRTAREMYGTTGFVAHHNTDGWGDTEPIDGVASGIWPFGGAWLSLALWDHYDFSRDEQFLREQAYPVMREAASFVIENLFDDGHGHLVSGPSLSPENKYIADDGKPASLDVSPTMDVELTTALFRRVVEASKLLNTDTAFGEKVEAALPKLIPLQVGKHGQLQEWRFDYDEAEVGHRHLSHLFAVYPSDEIGPDNTRLYAAARASLERRLANGGGGTGWSRAWVAGLWARFKEPDKARDSLRILLDQSTWPNLFDLHPPQIFQIDGNLGATAAIAEMLMQSQNQVIELLPALPAAWADGSVTGLRARGGLTMDFEWHAGKLTSAKCYATHGGTFRISIPGRQRSPLVVKLGAGETKMLEL